ncbi:MAG: DoxX family membrane protein [Propionibacteriaceae bacterium]|jgi:uncharacterized membrane protein YphA (DoxX/SURF4 family)|nr:DoxX family membrane protein [Propionibacteriaceae bacterium]
MRDWKNWVTLAARLILGIVFIIAGVGKIGNLTQSVAATNAYQILPSSVAQIVGYALPFCEVGLGLVLVAGLFTRVAGALGGLLQLAFIIAIASVWARGISIDCGCFGNGGPVDPVQAVKNYPWDILRDVGLLACGAWLVFLGKPFLAIDSWLFKPLDQIAAEMGPKGAKGGKGSKRR